MPEADRGGPPGGALARDSLTIRRLLLLTAGLAIGLGLFTPERQEGRLVRLNLDATLGLFSAAMLGLALPAPLFVLGSLPRARRSAPVASMPATMGLGALLMLPPVVMHRFAGGPGATIVCLFCDAAGLPGNGTSGGGDEQVIWGGSSLPGRPPGRSGTRVPAGRALDAAGGLAADPVLHGLVLIRRLLVPRRWKRRAGRARNPGHESWPHSPSTTACAAGPLRSVPATSRASVAGGERRDRERS